MTNCASSVYSNVADDVVKKVRDEFIRDGPGEDALKDLREVWERKMMQAGVVNGSTHSFLGANLTLGGPITTIHDLNLPYDELEDYTYPPAEMIFSPTPLQSPIQTTVPGTAEINVYNIPSRHNGIPSKNYGSINAVVRDTNGNAGKPTFYMKPLSPWMSQRPPLDVNIADVEGRDVVDRAISQQYPPQDFPMLSSGKRKREDEAGDASSCTVKIEPGEGDTSEGRYENLASKNRTKLSIKPKSSSGIPQNDGLIPDPHEDVLSTPNACHHHGGFNEGYSIPNTPTPNDLVNSQALPGENGIVVDDDEPPLNANDKRDSDEVDWGKDQNKQHLVLAQFDQATLSHRSL